MLMSQNECHASFLRRACLSETRASTRTSGCPASTDPVNEPAMPGKSAHTRQNTPVRTYATTPALKNSWNEYFSLIILSSV